MRLFASLVSWDRSKVGLLRSWPVILRGGRRLCRTWLWLWEMLEKSAWSACPQSSDSYVMFCNIVCFDFEGTILPYGTGVFASEIILVFVLTLLAIIQIYLVSWLSCFLIKYRLLLLFYYYYYEYALKNKSQSRLAATNQKAMKNPNRRKVEVEQLVNQSICEKEKFSVSF